MEVEQVPVKREIKEDPEDEVASKTVKKAKIDKKSDKDVEEQNQEVKPNAQEPEKRHEKEKIVVKKEKTNDDKIVVKKEKTNDDKIVVKKDKTDDESDDNDDQEPNPHTLAIPIIDSTEVAEEGVGSSDDEDPLVAVAVTEPDVGICEYLGSHSGFTGIIKQRYSDFLVNEIAPDGKVVKLEDVTAPEEPPEIPLDGLVGIISDETKGKLEELSNGGRGRVTIEVDDKSKEDRRIVHTAVKTMYPNLVSNTEVIRGKKIIIVTHPRRDRHPRQSWPANRGNYTHFVLYKENIDTIEAMSLVANLLGTKVGFFGYAGVKDKRAKTVQRASVYRVEAAKLIGVNKILRHIVMGNVSYHKSSLRLGDLKGNRFQIVLRSVSGNDDHIREAMESLAEKGFINYYGMQRFGTTNVPTHDIGLAVLKSEWSTVVDLIMKPRPGDDEYMARCRKLWSKTKDATSALRALRKQNSIEAQLLHGIRRHGKRDLVNALNMIPRNTRMMYVHSYQSCVWNRILSKRIQKFGLESMEGDLILKQDEVAEAEASGKRASRCVPTFLEANQEASIYDVVIPLFGHDIIYPKNEIADWYREMLKEDGLDIDNIKHNIRDYSLSGSYRAMVVRPTGVEWSIHKYKEANIPLLRSDWDVLRDEPSPPPSPEASDETLRAVKLSFELPRSSYATMALREILRTDTSARFQASLTKQLEK